jgi:hypothetical protein
MAATRVTHNVAQFGLRDMVACSAVLRQIGQGAQSIEDVAERTVHWLYEHLVDDAGSRACALVRIFQTRPAHELTPDLLRIAGLPQPPPAVPCLVLLSTVGQKSEWNSPLYSLGHRVIALSSPEAVRRTPMVSELLRQFGVNVATLLNPDNGLLLEQGDHTFNVFHVSEARGSPWVPAQKDFVLPYGIRSVLGFGGLLPHGSLFALILFSKAAIPRSTADQFKTLALSVKLSLLPFVKNTAPVARDVA